MGLVRHKTSTRNVQGWWLRENPWVRMRPFHPPSPLWGNDGCSILTGIRIPSAAREAAGNSCLWCVRYLMKMKFLGADLALLSLSYKIPTKPLGFQLLQRSRSCSVPILSNLRDDFLPELWSAHLQRLLVLVTHRRVRVLWESHVPIIHTKWIRWGMKRAWKGKARSKFSFLNVSTRQLLASVMMLKKNELLLPWFNL